MKDTDMKMSDASSMGDDVIMKLTCPPDGPVARSSHMHPEVRRAVDAYDPYWSEATQKRDGGPSRMKGSAG